jgi:hypothetical protein
VRKFNYGKAKDNVQKYARFFGCTTGSTHFKYLGIPMHHKKLSNSDWIMIERFQKKLSSWKGKFLSAGGWLVLINSALTSLSMYMLSRSLEESFKNLDH